MVFHWLRLEYALEGKSNFIASRERIEAMLEDTGLKEFFEQAISNPVATDAKNLAKWKKHVEKAT